MAVLTIVLIFASFLGIGWLASRRSGRLAGRGGATGAAAADEFLVAGRAMPLWLATFTMTATLER